MNDDPLYIISKSAVYGDKQTLRIYNGLDKIENQFYHTFKFDDRQVVITQYDGQWVDLGGKNPKEAHRLGLLLEQLDSVYHPEKDWLYLKASDFNKEIGNENQLLYDGVIGVYGVEKQVSLTVNGTLLTFDLQRIINARNSGLQKIPANHLYEILINYNLELKKPPLHLIVRSPDFKPLYECYFDYVVTKDRQVFLVGVTFGEFQLGRYMSQLVALIQLPSFY
ncbi:hypothetical protein ACVW0P_002276 [Mucilaginibacter sp. UYNi724]